MRRTLLNLLMLLAVTGLLYVNTGNAEARRKQPKIPTEQELSKAIGPSGTFAPALFKDLQKGMSPGQVKDLFDRMTRVSPYGYAKAKLKGYKGVWFVRFHFAKDEATDKRQLLKSAQIVYKPKLRKNKTFFPLMMKLSQAKWGPASDAGQVARKIVTWLSEDKKQVIQFARFGDRYEMNYEL